MEVDSRHEFGLRGVRRACDQLGRLVVDVAIVARHWLLLVVEVRRWDVFCT